jgi:beta-lactamase regulating signal transducer with metallopeptidase domain
MDRSVGLLAASGLVNFLLKTTAEWLVCLLLVRVAGSARTRFNLWLTMLLGFLAQWVWMWTRILRAAFPSAATFPATAQASRGNSFHAARIAVDTSLAGTVTQAMAVLLLCYLAVLGWRTIGTLAARVRLARAMRHKSAPGPTLAMSFHEALEQTAAYGYRLRDCELWVLPGLPSPATLGWWQPQVIVPPICQTQDAAELKVVFWHELMHIERRDALWNAMVRACRNVLWFHPCVHHAVLALNAQRELACDAAVVREHPHSRDVYASCLVRFARARDLSPEPSVAGIEMASSAALLTTRVRSILSEARRASRLSRAMRATTGILLVGLMAATVPAMNVLFAEGAVIAPSVRLPIAIDVKPAERKRAAKSASVRMQGAESMRSVNDEAAGDGIAAIQHDDGLAAEHRAAMDILTESTGMEAPAAGGGRLAPGLSGTAAGHGTGVQSSTSWTSVAVEAAERMGPLMSGRDADDHH